MPACSALIAGGGGLCHSCRLLSVLCVLAQDSVTLAWQPPPDNGSAITFYSLEMDDGCGGDFHHVYTGQAEPSSAVVTKLQVRVCVVVCLQ